MALSTAKNSIALNALHEAYLQDPEKGCQPLLTKVRSVARKTFRDDDFVQEFVILTWQNLPLRDLPCTFGGWIWRRLQWRRIDFIRRGQLVLNHEVQVPEMVNEDGDSLGLEQTLDILAYQATQDSINEPPGELDSIPDKFIRRVAQELLTGYTQHDIALRLGVNPSTLRSRLLRYRRANDQAQELGDS